MKTALLVTLFIIANLVCKGDGSTNWFPNVEEEYNKANPKMIWGEVTNFLRGDPSGESFLTSLRSGINVSNGVIVLSGNPLKTMQPARLCLENFSQPLLDTFSIKYDQGVPDITVPSTNWVSVYLPPINERFEFAMINANGVQISKTPLGLTLGRLSALKPKTAWYHYERNHARTSLFPKGVDDIPFIKLTNLGLPLTAENIANITKMYDFDPMKYFILKEPGLYKLTIAQRLYVNGTNQFLKTITLPPVSVDVRVEN